MAINLVTAPDDEPVTLDEAKEHLRITSSDDDNTIAELIRVARERTESRIRRALATQTWDLTLDAFPTEILVPLPPLQSVTSITYTDEDGASQTLSASLYDVDTASTPGRIRPAWGEAWPSTRAVMNAVTVRFVAGYGTAPEDIPAPLRQAMLLMLGELFQRREDGIAGTTVAPVPLGFEALAGPYRLPGYD